MRLVREVLLELLLDRQIGIEQLQRLLREVAHLQARAEPDRPRVGRQRARRSSSAASSCRRRSRPITHQRSPRRIVRLKLVVDDALAVALA